MEPIDKIKMVINKHVGYAEQEIYDALNEYTKFVIKDALDTAAERAKVVKDLGENKEEIPEFDVTECYYDENGYPIYVEEESITNAFEETYAKFSVK